MGHHSSNSWASCLYFSKSCDQSTTECIICRQSGVASLTGRGGVADIVYCESIECDGLAVNDKHGSVSLYLVLQVGTATGLRPARLLSKTTAEQFNNKTSELYTGH